MEWNWAAIIALSLASISGLVWIIRLEGKVKEHENMLSGKYGILEAVKEIRDKVNTISEKLVKIETQLGDLIEDHDRINCQNYKKGLAGD